MLLHRSFVSRKGEISGESCYNEALLNSSGLGESDEVVVFSRNQKMPLSPQRHHREPEGVSCRSPEAKAAAFRQVGRQIRGQEPQEEALNATVLLNGYPRYRIKYPNTCVGRSLAILKIRKIGSGSHVLISKEKNMIFDSSKLILSAEFGFCDKKNFIDLKCRLTCLILPSIHAE